MMNIFEIVFEEKLNHLYKAIKKRDFFFIILFPLLLLLSLLLHEVQSMIFIYFPIKIVRNFFFLLGGKWTKWIFKVFLFVLSKSIWGFVKIVWVNSFFNFVDLERGSSNCGPRAKSGPRQLMACGCCCWLLVVVVFIVVGCFCCGWLLYKKTYC